MNKSIYPIALTLISSLAYAEQANEYFSCQPYTAKSYAIGSGGSTDYDINCKIEPHIVECQRFRIDKSSLSASGGSYIYEYSDNKTKRKLVISRTNGTFYEDEIRQGAYETHSNLDGICELKKEVLKY
jgi:hypothetical protein